MTDIKPGTMCYVRGNKGTAALNGRIVTVIKQVTDFDEKYLSVCKTMSAHGLPTKAKVFLCKSSSPLPCTVCQDDGASVDYLFDVRPISGTSLVPISDPDIDISEDVQEILEMEGTI